MGRVLFIAYYFPPISSSGVFRSAKFVKYLPRCGWQPYVVSTTTPLGIHSFDQTLLNDIPPDTPVWRVPTPQPRPYSALGQRLPWPKAGRSDPHDSATPGVPGHHVPPAGASWLKRLLRALALPLRLVEEPPIDKELYWSLRLIPLAWRIIRQQRCGVIYTSSAPWSAAIAGLALKRLTGRPWVMDMRDPWVSDEYTYRAGSWQRRVDTAVERTLLRAADRIVITSRGFAGELSAVARRPLEDEVVEITNGFDPDDFAGPEMPRAPNPGTRQIVHLGTAIWERFQPLWLAIDALHAEPPILNRLRFTFHGWHEPRVAEESSAAMRAGNLGLGPAIAHRQAIGLMQNADVLLLLMGAQAHWSRLHPGKIFEYLRAGKPVLGVGPLGVASELIERCGVGCFVQAHDTERLVAVLRQIALDYPAFCAEWYRPRPEIIAQYDRRVQTGCLAAVFDSVAKK